MLILSAPNAALSVWRKGRRSRFCSFESSFLKCP